MTLALILGRILCGIGRNGLINFLGVENKEYQNIEEYGDVLL